MRRAGVIGGVLGAAAALTAGGVAAERYLVRQRRERAAPPRRAFTDLEPDRTRVVHTEDGVALHVEEVGPPGAPLSVVFVHGFALSLRSFYFQRRDLAERFGAQIRMVFYDQRSHGRSGASVPDGATMEQLGRDLAAIIEATVPTGPIVLVGHSMGGMAIQCFAASYPGMFSATSTAPTVGPGVRGSTVSPTVGPGVSGSMSVSRNAGVRSKGDGNGNGNAALSPTVGPGVSGSRAVSPTVGPGVSGNISVRGSGNAALSPTVGPGVSGSVSGNAGVRGNGNGNGNGTGNAAPSPTVGPGVSGNIVGVALISTSAGELGQVPLGLPALFGRVQGLLTGALLRTARRQANLVEGGRRIGTDIAWLITRRLSFGDKAIRPDVVDFLHTIISATPIVAIADFHRTLMRHDGTAGLGALQGTDTVIVVGSADVMTPLAHSERLAAELPKAQLTVLDSAGHVVLMERPEEVDAVVGDLVERALATARKPKRRR